MRTEDQPIHIKEGTTAVKVIFAGLIGVLLGVGAGAEPVMEGQVWLASGEPAVGARVVLFDLTDLRRSVGTTVDASGHFALSLGALGGRVGLPTGFGLGQNYPNPFNPGTVIPYQLAAQGYVRLEVFNLLGQRVVTLMDGEQVAGAYAARWDARDAAGYGVSAGVYFYRLTVDAGMETRRMVLIDGSAGVALGGTVPTQGAVERIDAGRYGLTVSGAGVATYIDADFRVGAGPVEVVVDAPGAIGRGKVVEGGILGDVNNDGKVDFLDALLVALYSIDSSLTAPNNGDISLGDVNGDGQVDLSDAFVLAAYLTNPLDPMVPAEIGEAVGESGDLDSLFDAFNGVGDDRAVEEPSDDRAVLVALYEATGGDDWERNTNWLSAEPLYKWYGVRTDTVGGEEHVIGLAFNRYVGLTGSIPEELGQLKNLQYLIFENTGLTGPIPAALGQLHDLQKLSLLGNGLTGLIPAELGQLGNLRELYLTSNGLTGSIPAELGQLHNLRELWLDNNKLTGTIPAALGQLQNLEWLMLQNNKLTGTIPVELGQLQNLHTLHLWDNNLTGCIPSGLSSSVPEENFAHGIPDPGLPFCK